MPELTDEWVSDNLGEFDTVEQWNESLRESLSENKMNQMRQQLVSKITDALTGLTEIEAPEALVNADLNQRVQGTMQQFQAQGIDFGQWMQATGQDPEQFIESMRGQSEQAVKVDLAMRAVVVAESIEVDDHELEAEYARMAMQYNQKAKEIRKAYEQNDAVGDLIGQISKNKALDWLVHNVDFVDEDGNPMDRDLVLGHGHDADGNHIHDHDHDEQDIAAAANAVISATDQSNIDTSEDAES